MRIFAAVLGATIACTTHAFAQEPLPPSEPLPPPTTEPEPLPSEPPASEPLPPSPPPTLPAQDDDRPSDSAIDLHLDTGWSMRHFDSLTLRAPDFGVGAGVRGPGAGLFLVLRFAPGTTKEDLTVRDYGADLDFQLIWGHFRLEFGIGGDLVTVDRVTRDGTILGKFAKVNLGPRVDVVQWEPITVFLKAIGSVGCGDGLYSSVFLGGGIEFDVAKIHPASDE